jgi:hypothetical protein
MHTHVLHTLAQEALAQEAQAQPACACEPAPWNKEGRKAQEPKTHRKSKKNAKSESKANPSFLLLLLFLCFYGFQIFLKNKKQIVWFL